jgi:hypothetical protein
MIYDHELLTLEAIVDDSVTTSEVSVSLGLIVTELVINALKHAFPARERAGHITVEYWSRPTGWRLTVEDNGVGMPGDHLTRKPGLGTGIVDALSGQLDASVTITALNPGTESGDRSSLTGRVRRSSWRGSSMVNRGVRCYASPLSMDAVGCGEAAGCARNLSVNSGALRASETVIVHSSAFQKRSGISRSTSPEYRIDSTRAASRSACSEPSTSGRSSPSTMSKK